VVLSFQGYQREARKRGQFEGSERQTSARSGRSSEREPTINVAPKSGRSLASALQ
jgi:hypothetical protein